MYENILCELRNISYINRGGCGIAAYLMYLGLKADNSLANDFAFVLLHRDEYNVRKNKSIIESNESEQGIVPCHMAIHNNGTVFDCEKVIDLDFDSEKTHLFTTNISFIINLIRNLYGWNKRYIDHYGLICHLEEQLSINLSQIKPTKQ